MKALLKYALLSLITLFLSSCYINKYYSLKKQYEAFSKDYAKIRAANTKLKEDVKRKEDSLMLMSKKLPALRKDIQTNDSLIFEYSNKIKKDLGGDPWTDSMRSYANTCNTIKYMSKNEKDVVLWLNLARMYPDLYAELYIDLALEFYNYSEWMATGRTYIDLENRMYYVHSCYFDMKDMKALNALQPCEKCYESAKCHATESGKNGYIGHERTNCKAFFSGECCHYGYEKGSDIIYSLLIDNGIPSLGHRNICLGNYNKIGVSQQSHSSYKVNTVLDFQ